ncbi:hypothetical protein Q9L58_000659 [Maublancomyces gigas]|uniref:Uncharacterized protein n=1 Tax=Discina gigas TaxID=1032678 RepID=A0ABR3GXE8_9PEZI
MPTLGPDSDRLQTQILQNHLQVDGVDEGLELGGVFGLDLPEVNEVYRHTVLFHLFGKLNEGLFIFTQAVLLESLLSNEIHLLSLCHAARSISSRNPLSE